MSKVRPVRYVNATALKVIGFTKPSICHKFMNQSNKKPYRKQIKENCNDDTCLFLFPMSPEKHPISPQAIICQGVQGPCPKNIFEINAAVLPTRNPSKGPKTNPLKATRNVVGFIFGNATNGTLVNAAKALRVAIIEISFVPRELFSK